jgi:UBA/TS-N domain
MSGTATDELVALGFPLQLAQYALKRSKGDFAAATEYCKKSNPEAIHHSPGRKKKKTKPPLECDKRETENPEGSPETPSSNFFLDLFNGFG